MLERAERYRQRSAAAACERLDADPERLAKLSARLDTLYALQQKHRAADEAELIAARDGYAARLAAIVHGDEEIAATEKRRTEPSRKRPHWPTVCTRRAKRPPRASRNRSSRRSTQLGMPETVFAVALTPLAELGRTGRDNVDFLFTANRE